VHEVPKNVTRGARSFHDSKTPGAKQEGSEVGERDRKGGKRAKTGNFSMESPCQKTRESSRGRVILGRKL